MPRKRISSSSSVAEKRFKQKDAYLDEPTLRIGLEFRNQIINNLNQNSLLLLNINSTATTVDKRQQVKLNEDLCKKIMNFKLQYFVSEKLTDDSNSENESSIVSFVTKNKNTDARSTKNSTTVYNEKKLKKKSVPNSSGDSGELCGQRRKSIIKIKKPVTPKTIQNSDKRTTRSTSIVRPEKLEHKIQGSQISYKERWMAKLDLMPITNIQVKIPWPPDDLPIVKQQLRIRDQASVNNLSDIRGITEEIIMKEIGSHSNDPNEHSKVDENVIDINNNATTGTKNQVC